MLREAFQYATKYTPLFHVLINEEITRKYQVKEPVTQQHINNDRLAIKITLRNQYFKNWLETQNSSSVTSREKFTHKEVKRNYQFEDYLTICKIQHTE